MSDRTLSRLAWVAFVVTTLLFVAAAVLLVVEGTARRGDWNGSAGSELAFMASIFPFAMVGGLIASRRPRNTIGWILLAIGFSWGLGEFLDGYDSWGFAMHAHTLPGALWLNPFSGALWVPAVGLLGTFALLLFPDGHLPSPGWRYLARTSAVSLVVIYLVVAFSPGPSVLGRTTINVRNPLGVGWLEPFVRLAEPAVLLIPLCIAGCAWSLIRRFRRSEGVERLQLKWLTTGAAVVAIVYLATMLASIGSDWSSATTGWVSVMQAISSMTFGIVALASGFAVLRYRLYDIEVVINRALVYGSLAVFITGVYVAVVVGFGRLIGNRDGSSIGLSIAATAIVAFVFQPVRERVQHVANRLVYGKRATPYEVLSRFSEDLGALGESDELLPRMAKVLADGIRASRADVWLRVDGTLFHGGSWPAASRDGDGEPARVLPAPDTDGVPAIDGSTRTVAVRHQGEMLGALSVTKPPGEPLSPVEAALLDDLAGQAGVALRNARLTEQLRASRQRIVVAEDEERRRLERDIRDGAQRQLVALSVAAAGVRSSLGGTAEKTATILGDSIRELDTALQEIQELARGIHPSILTNDGLGAALESLAERSPVPVTLDVKLDGRAPAQVETTAYFAVSEALANVAKYAAASHVTVSAERADGSLLVRVVDDGVGGADPSAGSGLRGLMDRVAAVGGQVAVESPKGRGTTLRLTLPYVSPSPADAEPAP